VTPASDETEDVGKVGGTGGDKTPVEVAVDIEEDEVKEKGGGDDLECALCLNDVMGDRANVVVLPCNHEFCRGCMLLFRANARSKGRFPTCPMCRNDQIATFLDQL